MRSEKVYDEQIFPLMRQIIKICKKHKLPMFASFEYTKGDFCTTALAGDGYEAHPVFTHFNALSKSLVSNGVNIDKYLTWVIRQVEKDKEHRHSSIYLKILMDMGDM